MGVWSKPCPRPRWRALTQSGATTTGLKSGEVGMVAPDQYRETNARAIVVARQLDGTTSSPVAWDRVRAASVDVAMMAMAGLVGQTRRRRRVDGLCSSGLP